MKPREVLAMCREKEVKAVDLRFADFLGAWQHLTIPVGKLEEEMFEAGLGFDGSSIRGRQAINESDMLLVPVPDTAIVDPFAELPTLVMICMVQDPITREDYTRDPRNIARKAMCVAWSRIRACAVSVGMMTLLLPRMPLASSSVVLTLLPVMRSYSAMR